MPLPADAVRVSDILDQTARAYGDQPAMKVKRDGLWSVTTWREYRDQSRAVAKGLMHLGLQSGQGVSIMGYNQPAWFLADIGAILAGGVPAGIYTTNTADQCEYIAGHCEAAIAIVENASHLAKFKAVWDNLPDLKYVVLMHGSDTDERVVSWDKLLELGGKVAEADLDARIAAQKPDDVCTLIYTSGTTGNPKAVMITHDNITWTAKSALTALDVRVGDNTISYLPLSHIAEQVVSLHGPMMLGGCVWFAESIDKLGDNLREVRPHYFLGVPRVWEKIQAKMQAAGAANPPLRKKIAAWARGVGLKGGYAKQRNEALPWNWGLADKIVFSKVREKLGLDRCRLQVTSAAPISKDTLEFFLSLGVIIHEVYGMSECTGPATVSTHAVWETTKAGFVLPGAEIKIDPKDGEICMRGRHIFKGYYKNPEATAEALDSDGWLRSGDVGVVDARGLLKITDRKKDLLITAGGENIAPQVLEGLLKSINVVGQAVVVGDRMKYLAALLTLDPEKVPNVAASSTDPAMLAELQKEIDKVNDGLAQVQKIKKWIVIPVEFSIEGGELTPTMKVKRKVVNTKYAEQIAGLYA
ncbi:MAG: long-chain fatty acid--CoA ligase [Myxococcales bacterium]|nr:long-chain fatty acid--CoA ligase [Myxococcales bacterium]